MGLLSESLWFLTSLLSEIIQTKDLFSYLSIFYYVNFPLRKGKSGTVDKGERDTSSYM